MAPYIVAFLVSGILFQIGGFEEAYRNNRRRAFLLYGIAFIPLCLLAGARDLSVGTDTGGYGIYLFNQGLAFKDCNSYMTALDSSSWDIAPLYAYVAYFVIRVFKSQFMYFALIEFAAIFPIFFVLRKLCTKQIGISMFAYLLMFYIPSLNMMRQSVALGLLVLAVYFCVNGNVLRSIIWSTAAILSHYSAIIVVPFCLIWVALVKKNELNELELRARSKQIVFIIVAVVIIVTLFFRPIAAMFSHLDGFGRLFLYASHGGSKLSTTSFAYTILLLLGSIVSLSALKGSRTIEARYFAFLISFSIPFFFLSGIDNTIARMMDFCTVFSIPLFAVLLNQSGCSTKTMGVLLIMSACIFRFIICFCLLGFEAAIPYSSALLGI